MVLEAMANTIGEKRDRKGINLEGKRKEIFIFRDKWSDHLYTKDRQNYRTNNT